MNELLAKLLTALGQTIAADASQAQFEADVSSLAGPLHTSGKSLCERFPSQNCRL